MTAREQIREQLAQALAHQHSCDTLRTIQLCNRCRQSADVLAPLVGRLRAEAAAEALEAAAAEQEAESTVTSWTKGSHAGGHQCAAGFLRDRAAAVRARAGL